MPGRPTVVEHRAPEDNLREHYDCTQAHPLTKLHAVTITAGENKTHDYYMTIGPMFADPIARQLYAEIASIEEQHVTQYESLTDPNETPPELAEELIEGAVSSVPSSDGGSENIAESRTDYIAERYPLGSMPAMPVSEEAEATEDQAAMAVLLDKLSERLAFERMGTRLYEALLNKCETLDEQSPGPTLEEIKHIGSEELEHFLMLNQVITDIGGDPTVESPGADVAGVASMGLMQVLTDPRSSMPQCLQALMTAELTDNAGWELLIELVDGLGYNDLKLEFETALVHEEEHLQNVRDWLSDMVLDKAEL